MAIVGKITGSVGSIKGSERLKYEEDTELVKELMSTTKGTSNTANSGSTNTSATRTSGGTNASNNTTTNSGSTNVTELSGSTNRTANSGSTNNTVTAASKNSVENSGSVNTTQVGPSRSTVSHSGSVNTSQLMLTTEAVNHLTKQMMESTQGLAAVSKGQNMSGGYNTTANTMITNDLLSRVAGEVAARGAQTVTNIGGSSSTTENSGSLTTQNIGASNSIQNIGETRSTQEIGASSSIQDIGGSTNTNRIGGSSVYSQIGATSNFSESDVTQIIGGSSSRTDTLSEMLGMEKATTRTEGTKDKETQQTEKKAEAESKWILCTELHRQGRMPHKYFRHGYRAFAKYDEQSKKGYYIWAVPALEHLKKHPFSALSNFLCIMLNARAEYISAEAGCKEAKKSVLGWAAKNLYWGCWILSRTIARNYQIPASQNITEGVTS